MKSAFPGFSREGLTFLRDLKKNNDREWFTPRKAIYEEQLRLPMIELVRAIHREMLDFAPQYVGEPAKCIFRIYRDTRFAKDKTPYKTHVAAWFRRNGIEKNRGAGYYFSISPEEVEIAGGIYHPEPDVLLSVRQHIALHHAAFQATYGSAKFRKLLGDLQGESAARAPKGFNPAHPAIDVLKRKMYCFFINLDPAVATTPKLFGEVVKRFEIMAPFVEFLNRPLLGTNVGQALPPVRSR
jgi:uncharacterized protein (TIGR02453 family)